jgi:hypothetical protein
MNDEHKPMSTGGEGWFEFEDGLTTSRRAVLGETYSTRSVFESSAILGRKKTVEPTEPTKTPDLPELLLRARRLFDAIGTHLPKRIAHEEIGDALEVLHGMVREGQPRWKLRVKILSTLAQVIAHALQDCVHALLGKAKAAIGSSSGKDHE